MAVPKGEGGKIQVKGGAEDGTCKSPGVEESVLEELKDARVF